MTSALSDLDERRLGIGEVLSLLQGDFPDVSISKIRFLEAEGLVEPQRTASGYRKFSEADVERLRYILRAQRDHYLPLRVIREHLDAVERGLTAPALTAVSPTVPAPREAPAPEDAEEPVQPELRLSQRELLRHAGIGADLLEALEEHGLVRSRGTGSDGAPEYDRLALQVASVVGEMSVFGIEPRHLRSLRLSVDREAGLIEQVARPLQRDSTAAAEATRQLTALSTRLHAALLRAAVGPLSDAAPAAG